MNRTSKPSITALRAEYARHRAEALAAGVRSKRGFETLCRRRLSPDDTSPAAWVRAARQVSFEFQAGAEANRRGISRHDAMWSLIGEDGPDSGWGPDDDVFLDL